MRLVPVPANESNPTIKVLCKGCGRWVLAQEAVADLDGEPFKAYYCAPCTPAIPGGTDVH